MSYFAKHFHVILSQVMETGIIIITILCNTLYAKVWWNAYVHLVYAKVWLYEVVIIIPISYIL